LEFDHWFNSLEDQQVIDILCDYIEAISGKTISMTEEEITVDEFKEWLATAAPGAKKTVFSLRSAFDGLSLSHRTTS
jgi:hypothetical protein